MNHRESDESLSECALVPALEPEHVSSIGIWKPKISIGVHIKSRGRHQIPLLYMNLHRPIITMGELTLRSQKRGGLLR
jgi:hypothetical protein